MTPSLSAWKRIWDNRTVDNTRGSLLSRLMAADGLDTGFGDVQETAWVAFVHRRATELGITPTSSVFEVGCGAGAFLYELYRIGCSVSGIDQSATLVRCAREAMPKGRFEVADATELPAGKVDIVVSCGVFLYFPSLAYARNVIDKMAAKARHAVAILDIPDQATSDASLRRRMASLGGADAYAERYRGLDHLYYDRTWLRETLVASGLSRAHVAEQDITGYENSAFRFNAWGFVHKPCPPRGRSVVLTSR